MGKLSRDPSTGKISRTAAGKLNAAVDSTLACMCDCGDSDSGECFRGCMPAQLDGAAECGGIRRFCVPIAEHDTCDIAGPNSFNYSRSATYRIDVADAAQCDVLCTGDVNIGPGSYGGRTYYISINNCLTGFTPPSGAVPFATLSGYYFNHGFTGRAGAPRFEVTDGSCVVTGAYRMSGLTMGLQDGGFATQQKLHVSTFPGAFLQSEDDPDASVHYTDNFCYGTTTLNAKACEAFGGPVGSDSNVQGGQWVMRPYCGCPVTCDHADCARVSVGNGSGGECTAEELAGYAGIYTKYQNEVIRDPAQPWLYKAGSAGCHWRYNLRLFDTEAGEFVDNAIIVWFDGVDYQVILARLFLTTAGYVLQQIFYAKEAAGLSCADGKLVGTAILTRYEDVIDSTKPDSELECNVIITFGSCVCPTTALTCCGRYVVTFTGFGTPFNYDGGGADPIWTETDSGQTIECVDDEELGLIWKLTANVGGGSYFWYTPVTGDCPPSTTEAIWSSHGTPPQDLVTITKAMCP